MKRILPTTSIPLRVSPSLSPPRRAGFPPIVACETESAAHSDPFFLDRLMENNQQTMHLALAQRVTSTHPGHLDSHPGPQLMR